MYKDNNKNIKNKKVIQTNGTPVSNYTVILDAGHGQPDRTELILQRVFKRKK